MKVWKPTLARPWSESEMAAILEEALKVLEQVGVATRHPVLRERLVGWGGARLTSDRVYLLAEPMRRFYEEQRAANLASYVDKEPEFALDGCWAGLSYCDPVTLQIRPATQADLIQMVRLWDARGVSGVVPVQPGDVPPALVTLAAERIALQHSRYLGGQLTVTDPEEVRYLVDMNLAANRRYTLMEEVAISPLRFNDHGLETAIQFAGNPDLRVEVTGAIPMAGVTCPLDPQAAVAQAVAERLALNLVCHLLGTEGAGFGLRLEPFDFQYSTIVFGSPEWCLFRTFVLQMSEFLGGKRVRGARFRSVSKIPDEQAACERTASALWQALLGGRIFGGVGQLSVDEVFSPQQAVIDREILAYVARLIKGMPSGSDRGAVEQIADGVAQGNFVGSDDTVARFRDVYDFPAIFRHWSLNRWREEGMPTLLDEAWDRAQAEISRSNFGLPDDQRAQVDRIYERAKRYVVRLG